MKKKGQEVTRSNTPSVYKSRKFILFLLLVIITGIVVILKLHDASFASIFSDWCLFLISAYAIYNGGNVGSKYVDNLNAKRNTGQLE